MNLQSKLAILADAAKYDASCASSGAAPRNSVGGRGMGSTEGMGICHSYAPDGRCISLLKILLTNFCQYDCLYCVNRVTSNVPRARFTVDEVVQLTLDFYRRNCIEGLFLSSGIIQSPDYTMEQVVEVARVLREEHDFRGYIHLKTIPDASPELMQRAGRYADRLSINIELPTAESLTALAPEKTSAAIDRSMARMAVHIGESRAARKEQAAQAIVSMPQSRTTRRASAPLFAPGGQSTQMIVGAGACRTAARWWRGWCGRPWHRPPRSSACFARRAQTAVRWPGEWCAIAASTRWPARLAPCRLRATRQCAPPCAPRIGRWRRCFSPVPGQ